MRTHGPHCALQRGILMGEDLGGDWRNAEWEESLDFVAKRMMTIREKHGADANDVFGSGAMTNEKAHLLDNFTRVAPGTASIDHDGRFCMSIAAA